MRDRKDGGHGPARFGTWIVLVAALMPALAVTAQAQQTGGAGEPPARIGPEWDWRNHQPNPAEIEARERASGRQLPSNAAEARDVDRLYRDLTGQDPTAIRGPQPRATDRR